MNITRLSIDLAKDVFQLYGVDGKQKCVLTKRITSRAKLIGQSDVSSVNSVLLHECSTIFD